MARINKTRYALLGMLAFGPASGYDIKKRMANSTEHFWQESDGAIYPILKQLAEDGMVTYEVENAATKPRKIYTITEDGIAELRDWLATDVGISSMRDEFLLKVFFGSHTEPEVTKQHIRDYQRKLEKLLVTYNKIEQQFQGKKDKAIFRYLTLRAGIIEIEAGLRWCDEALTALENK